MSSESLSRWAVLVVVVVVLLDEELELLGSGGVAALLEGERLDRLRVLSEVAPKGRRDACRQADHCVGELLGEICRLSTVLCLHGLTEPAELALQVIGVVDGQQPCPATARDDE